MRTARSRSFSLVGRRSTIRLPYVLPRRTIAMVEIMLSTSFCAVPALRRVEPVSTSGPTGTSIGVLGGRAERGAGVAGQADGERADARAAARGRRSRTACGRWRRCPTTASSGRDAGRRRWRGARRRRRPRRPRRRDDRRRPAGDDRHDLLGRRCRTSAGTPTRRARRSARRSRARRRSAARRRPSGRRCLDGRHDRRQGQRRTARGHGGVGVVHERAPARRVDISSIPAKRVRRSSQLGERVSGRARAVARSCRVIVCLGSAGRGRRAGRRRAG